MKQICLISYIALALSFFSYGVFQKIAGKGAEENITADEKERIDQWIRKNNLNEYGDPLDTMYTGGNPLFDETTGTLVDRYAYIMEKHCICPWNQ